MAGIFTFGYVVEQYIELERRKLYIYKAYRAYMSYNKDWSEI